MSVAPSLIGFFVILFFFGCVIIIIIFFCILVLISFVVFRMVGEVCYKEVVDVVFDIEVILGPPCVEVLSESCLNAFIVPHLPEVLFRVNCGLSRGLFNIHLSC